MVTSKADKLIYLRENLIRAFVAAYMLIIANIPSERTPGIS